MTEVVSLARQLIAVESGKGANPLPIIDLIKGRADERGLRARVVECQGLPRFVIVGKELERPRLAYFSQLETWERSPASVWRKTGFNPLQPTVREDRLYGLGAATGKADFAAKLLALEADPRPGVVVVGCLSSDIHEADLSSLWKELGGRPEYALFGVPSDLRRVESVKRSLRLMIEVPFSQEEQLFRLQRLQSENVITQTKFFSGPQWLKKMRDFILQLPAGVAVIGFSTTVNEFGVAIDGEIELDLSRQFSESLLERIQDLVITLQSFVRSLGDGADSGLRLGQVSINADHLLVEIRVETPKGLERAVLRSHLGKIQNLVEAWKGKISLKDLNLQRQLVGQEEFLHELDQMLPGVCSASESLGPLKFQDLDFVALGPGDLNFDQPEESVETAQIEEALHLYQRIAERMLT